MKVHQTVKQVGFTLIELLVVLAVLGILSAIAVPQYLDYLTRTRLARIHAYVVPLKKAISEFAQFNGGLNTQGLELHANAWTAAMTEHGLGMAAVPTFEKAPEIATNGITFDENGVIYVALTGALATRGSCGENAVIKFIPVVNPLVRFWRTEMDPGTVICRDEVAKWNY